MAIRLDDFVATLPEERQHAIKKRTAELIAEEAKLHQERHPRDADRSEPDHGQEHPTDR